MVAAHDCGQGLSMYVVTVLFTIKAAYLDAFMRQMNANAKTSLLHEVGCHQFDVCRSTVSPLEIFLYEVYESKEAFAVHLASEHFKEFNDLTLPWVDAKVVKIFERVHTEND